MSTPREHYDRLVNLMRANEAQGDGYSAYGSKVMPALEAFERLERFEERKAFQEGLEMMLRDDSQAVRDFGVEVCLGFFVFRDALQQKADASFSTHV